MLDEASTACESEHRAELGCEKVEVLTHLYSFGKQEYSSDHRQMVQNVKTGVEYILPSFQSYQWAVKDAGWGTPLELVVLPCIHFLNEPDLDQG